MFVKIRENGWINLLQCGGIDIRENEPMNWQIDFNHSSVFSIGTFRSEREAHEALDEIWEAFREGRPYFEPDPRKEMNVKIGYKWYAGDKPIDTYLEAIQRLGLEKIEERGVTFKDENIRGAKDNPIVTKNRIKELKQSDAGDYHILLPDFTATIKKILESIASELGIVDFEVTLYQE